MNGPFKVERYCALPGDVEAFVAVDASGICVGGRDDSDQAEGDAYALNCAYWMGVEAGIRRFAWWKGGTQYVGTCGTTLYQALQNIKDERGDPIDDQL